MANKVLETTFKGKDGGIISLMKETGANADTLKKKMLELQSVGKGGEDAGGGGLLKSLKANLGAKSELGQFGKILKGGGAVAAVSIIGNELKRAATEALDLKNQLAAGTISAGEFKVKMAESIPVIGSLVSGAAALDDFAASFDGFANSWFGKLIKLDGMNYAQKVTKELKVQKTADDAVAESLEHQKKLLVEILETRRKTAQEMGKVGREGDNLKQYELQVAAENRIADIQKKRTDALADANKRQAEAIKKIHDEDRGMDPAVQYKLEQNAAKQFAQEKLKINQGFNDEIKDANNLTFVEQMQAQKEHDQKMLDFKTETNKEITDSQTEAYARNLKLMGDSLGAELVMIQKNAQDKKDAILKELKEQSKGASLADQDVFQQAATAKIDAVDDDTREQAKLARKAQQESVVKTLQEGQLDVLRHQADQGDIYAEAELRRLELAKQNTDEQRKLLELLKQQLTPAERAAALAELQALKVQGHMAVEKQLADQSLNVLKQQAEYGATAEDRFKSKQQLEAATLKKQFEEAQKQAIAIASDPNATQADKAKAVENLKAIAATAGKEFDKQVGLDGHQLKKTADLQERGLLVTGVAAAARAQSDPAQVANKLSEQALKVQQDLLKKAEETRKMLEKQTPIQIIQGLPE